MCVVPEIPENISHTELCYTVFLSKISMDICNIPIRDPVMIVNNDEIIVATAWPTNDNTLTSATFTRDGNFIFLLK